MPRDTLLKEVPDTCKSMHNSFHRFQERTHITAPLSACSSPNLKVEDVFDRLSRLHKLLVASRPAIFVPSEAICGATTDGWLATNVQASLFGAATPILREPSRSLLQQAPTNREIAEFPLVQ